MSKHVNPFWVAPAFRRAADRNNRRASGSSLQIIEQVTCGEAWAQPLEPHTQKFDTGIKIVDPIFEPPKREDIVRNLLAAVGDTLSAEEALFSRLAGREDIPSFEKPEMLEWQQRLEAPPRRDVGEEIPWSDRTPAEIAFLQATERERIKAEERALKEVS